MAEEDGKVVSDDTSDTSTTDTAPPPVDHSAEIASLRGELKARDETLQALLSSRRDSAPPADTGASIGGLPSNVVAHLRTRGLSDADISANAPLIIPFIEVALQSIGPEVAGAVGRIQEEVENVRTRIDRDTYPHWDDVAKDVKALREDARRTGRAMTLDDAYNRAVVANFPKLAKKAAEAESTANSAAGRRASAATATSGITSVSGHIPDSAGLPSPAQLASMTPEDRLKIYDRLGDIPIQ